MLDITVRDQDLFIYLFIDFIRGIQVKKKKNKGMTKDFISKSLFLEGRTYCPPMYPRSYATHEYFGTSLDDFLHHDHDIVHDNYRTTHRNSYCRHQLYCKIFARHNFIMDNPMITLKSNYVRQNAIRN